MPKAEQVAWNCTYKAELPALSKEKVRAILRRLDRYAREVDDDLSRKEQMEHETELLNI